LVGLRLHTTAASTPVACQCTIIKARPSESTVPRFPALALRLSALPQANLKLGLRGTAGCPGPPQALSLRSAPTLLAARLRVATAVKRRIGDEKSAGLAGANPTRQGYRKCSWSSYSLLASACPKLPSARAARSADRSHGRRSLLLLTWERVDERALVSIAALACLACECTTRANAAAPIELQCAALRCSAVQRSQV
jgi:hypothetical protein